MDEFMVVTRETLDNVVRKTGWDRRWLKGELQDAGYRDCALVVFCSSGEWHKIFIHHEYDVAWVMNELSRRWGSNELDRP